MIVAHRIWWLVLCALMLQGCPGMVDRAPETVYESLLVAAYSAKGAARTVNDLYAQRSITKQQQMKALDQLQLAVDAMNAGLDAYEAGRSVEATDQLSRAEAILRAVSSLLSAYGADPA